MSDLLSGQVIELAFQLTVLEQSNLLGRVSAHMARTLESPITALSAKDLAGCTCEIWSPQDNGGAIAALNMALAVHHHLVDSTHCISQWRVNCGEFL